MVACSGKTFSGSPNAFITDGATRGFEARLDVLGVKFTAAPKMTVACIKRKGAYSGVGESMRELKSWIDAKGIEQTGYPFCLFYDNPSETGEAELRSEVCIPVVTTFQPEGEVALKEMPEIEVAETRHEGPLKDSRRPTARSSRDSWTAGTR